MIDVEPVQAVLIEGIHEATRFLFVEDAFVVFAENESPVEDVGLRVADEGLLCLLLESVVHGHELVYDRDVLRGGVLFSELCGRVARHVGVVRSCTGLLGVFLSFFRRHDERVVTNGSDEWTVWLVGRVVLPTTQACGERETFLPDMGEHVVCRCIYTCVNVGRHQHTSTRILQQWRDAVKCTRSTRYFGHQDIHSAVIVDPHSATCAECGSTMDRHRTIASRCSSIQLRTPYIYRILRHVQNAGRR